MGIILSGYFISIPECQSASVPGQYAQCVCEHVAASLRLSHDLSSDRSLVTVVSGHKRMGNIANVGIVWSARQSLLSLPQFVCLAPSLGVFIKYN